MKKLFLTLAFVAVAFLGNAQLFVSGNIGLGTTANKTIVGPSTTEGPKGFVFEFNPSIGYMFGDRVGAGIAFGYTTATAKQTMMNEEVKGIANSFSVSPYFRYIFADYGDVDLYADAMFSFSTGKTKAVAGSIESEFGKTTSWGVSIVPGISYMLTDHILLYSNINLLQLGYESVKNTEFSQVIDDFDVETIDNEFYFGFNGTSPLTMGIVWFF